MRLSKVDIVRQSVRQIVPMLAERRIPVTQIGDKAFVIWDLSTGEPKRVNLPNLPDNASDDLLIAVQGFLDHEVGHILFTDVRVAKEAKALGVEEMHNILEDPYVESKMQAKFKGSRKNLGETLGFALSKLVKPQVDKALKAGNIEEAKACLIMPACRAWAGQKGAQDFMDDNGYWQYVEKFREIIGEDTVAEMAKLESSRDALMLALKIKNRIEEAAKELEEEEERRRRRRTSKGGEGGEETNSEEGDFDDEAEDDEDGDEDEEEGDEEEDGDEDEEEEGEEDDEEDEEPVVVKSEVPPELDPRFIKKPKDLDSLMENVIRQQMSAEAKSGGYWPLSTDFDKVERYAPTLSSRDFSEAQRFEEKSRATVGMLQKHLERAVAAKSYSRYVPGHRSGRINSAALFRLEVNDDRVFKRKHIMRTKDAAVSLVVDCSGSMWGAKYDLAMSSAVAMAQALDRLNITNQVCGFTTTHPSSEARMMLRSAETETKVRPSRVEPIYIPIFKDFGERLTPERRAAMVESMRGLDKCNNIDGESLIYAARMLLAQNKQRHIMIVLSDGAPACHGDNRALSNHLKETVRNLSQSGVDIFGIGVMTDEVEHFYPHHQVINDLDDLPGVIMGRLERMLLNGY